VKIGVALPQSAAFTDAAQRISAAILDRDLLELDHGREPLAALIRPSRSRAAGGDREP
jgi:hypothetical protein